MDRRRQYELLQDVDLEDSVDSVPPTLDSGAAAAAPVPTSTLTEPGNTSGVPELLDQPPAYSVAVDLPTYEECLRAKQLEEDDEQRQETPVDIEISSESHRRVDGIIGTDGMFILGFIFAFLFNWVGLIAAFCLMQTCAGRFGALSGFGLSLVKWVAIAKRNNWSMGVAEDNPWVWWLLVAFGVLISCSGTLQYLRIKYLWSRTRNANVLSYPF